MDKKINEFSSRKPNRLKKYDYSLNGYYFITVCAKNRENTFGEFENSVGAGLVSAQYENNKISDNGQPQGLSLLIWQRSFYDHVIRNDDSLNKIREYIRNNPLKWKDDENNFKNYGLKGQVCLTPTVR